jgi:pimeloyl-ACP methyl ester carboxylesterase
MTPGWTGNTKSPPRATFAYRFDNLARVVEGFVDAPGLTSYALYIFDYGAPVGLRVALAQPERVSAIISQDGNAYLDGFGDAWGPWQTYWRDPAAEHRGACRASLSPDTIRIWQYFNGADASHVSPDGYTLDILYDVARRGGDPARPHSRLWERPGPLPRIPGILSGTPAAVACCLGQAGRSPTKACRRK